MSTCYQPVPAFFDSLSSEMKLEGAGDQCIFIFDVEFKFACNNISIFDLSTP